MSLEKILRRDNVKNVDPALDDKIEEHFDDWVRNLSPENQNRYLDDISLMQQAYTKETKDLWGEVRIELQEMASPVIYQMIEDEKQALEDLQSKYEAAKKVHWRKFGSKREKYEKLKEWESVIYKKETTIARWEQWKEFDEVNSFYPIETLSEVKVSYDKKLFDAFFSDFESCESDASRLSELCDRYSEDEKNLETIAQGLGAKVEVMFLQFIQKKEMSQYDRDVLRAYQQVVLHRPLENCVESRPGVFLMMRLYEKNKDVVDLIRLYDEKAIYPLGVLHEKQESEDFYADLHEIDLFVSHVYDRMEAFGGEKIDEFERILTIYPVFLPADFMFHGIINDLALMEERCKILYENDLIVKDFSDISFMFKPGIDIDSSIATLKALKEFGLSTKESLSIHGDIFYQDSVIINQILQTILDADISFPRDDAGKVSSSFLNKIYYLVNEFGMEDCFTLMKSFSGFFSHEDLVMFMNDCLWSDIEIQEDVFEKIRKLIKERNILDLDLGSDVDVFLGFLELYKIVGKKKIDVMFNLFDAYDFVLSKDMLQDKFGEDIAIDTMLPRLGKILDTCRKKGISKKQLQAQMNLCPNLLWYDEIFNKTAGSHELYAYLEESGPVVIDDLGGVIMQSITIENTLTSIHRFRGVLMMIESRQDLSVPKNPGGRKKMFAEYGKLLRLKIAKDYNPVSKERKEEKTFGAIFFVGAVQDYSNVHTDSAGDEYYVGGEDENGALDDLGKTKDMLSKFTAQPVFDHSSTMSGGVIRQKHDPGKLIRDVTKYASTHTDEEIMVYVGLHGGEDGSAGAFTKHHFQLLANVSPRVRLVLYSCYSGKKTSKDFHEYVGPVSGSSSGTISTSTYNMHFLDGLEKCGGFHEAQLYVNTKYFYSLAPMTEIFEGINDRKPVGITDAQDGKGMNKKKGSV